MAVAQELFLAVALLFVSLRLHCSSPLPGCPEPCSCQRASLLNCSSSGLSLVPQHILDSVTELDLSHNLLDSVTLGQPHHNLRNVWLGNNSITHLSLCIERNPGGRYGRSINPYHLRPWSRQRCVSWAPSLQLLSVERNQLEQLPKGLEGSESLQVLQLSFNRISTLQPGDLGRLRQLIELHLQHNLITSLHPQMFQDLAQLRVLDLRFNKLTSLHPLMYLSLHNIGADVRLDGNRWQCDCSMRSLRRRMAYDSSRGLQAWSVVCASPSILSGRELLQLEEDDLSCIGAENRPELHQDVTVYSGSEILLSCSAQDSMWWTPSGQASASQTQAGLLINDISERDTGLYVCVSEEHDIVSVFNLQISKIEGAKRKIRSLTRTSQQITLQGPANRIGQERNQRAIQSNLVLAVCLSVFITFLIAFILGVLARPCIDILWRRVTRKKSSSETSVSSAEQRQYDNEAYCTGGEPEATGTHRERRVTFNTVDFRENSNVQYYDTVASGVEESNNQYTVIKYEAVAFEKDTHAAVDSESENSFQQSRPEETQKDGRDLSGVTDAGHKHNMEYEHIPDPVELDKRSLSSCSDSSMSDKVRNEDQMTWRGHITTKSSQVAADSLQQRADFSTASKVVQISAEGSEIAGFSSEPFADWSPHTMKPSQMDPDQSQENEEQFEFSDSDKSFSPRSSSVCGFFNDSKLTMAPTSYKKSNDMSSSSSYISEEEPTEYTVNSDKEEEEEEEGRERSHNKGEDYTVTRQLSDKGDMPSSRIVTGEWETKKKVEPMPRTKWRVPSLGVTSHSESLDTGAPLTSAAHSSSSSSESEAEITDLKVELNTGRVNEGIKIREPVTLSSDLHHQYTSQKDINAPLPATDSTSSDESMDETRRPTMRQQRGDIDMAGLPVSHSVSRKALNPQWPPNLDHITPNKRHSDSSSSSESSDETTDQNEKQGEKHRTGFKFQESVSQVPEKQWPALDLEHTTRIKRRLDIKASSPPPDSSSSSDSDNETPNHVSKQDQGQMHMARLPNKVPQTVRRDSPTQRPALALEHTAHINRHLDITAPSPDTDSSSSSDSEDETTGHIKKQKPGKVDIAGLSFQESKTGRHDSDKTWPTVNLEDTTRIKRRLDIKAPSPDSDSSSSSDSEDGTTKNIKKREQKEAYMPKLSIKVSQTGSDDPPTQWPALDLEHTTRIKRRLDIKASSPPPDSSSSSDSEDETTGHIKKQKPGKVDTAGIPFQGSLTGRHDLDKMWPAQNLEHTTSMKKQLDLKAPSPTAASSSSSDSDDKTKCQNKRPELVGIAGLPFKESQRANHNPETWRSEVDLNNITHIKRRLEIKAPLPPPDSLLSSGSTNHTAEGKRKEVIKVSSSSSSSDEQEEGMGELSNPPTTVEPDPDSRWPQLGLSNASRVKRRLDIRARSPESSSSSNESDVGTTDQPSKIERDRTDVGKWSMHVPYVNRRQNTKAPTSQPDLIHSSVSPGFQQSESSSSASESENENRDHAKLRPRVSALSKETEKKFIKSSKISVIHTSHRPKTDHGIKLEKYTVISDNVEGKATSDNIKMTSKANPELESRWAMMNLGISRFRKRLEITSRTNEPRNLPSSRSQLPVVTDEEASQIQASLYVGQAVDTKLQWSQSQTEEVERMAAGIEHKTSSSESSEDETIEHSVPDLSLGVPRVKRRLNVTAPSPGPSSSSSSCSENEVTEYTAKQSRHVSDITDDDSVITYKRLIFRPSAQLSNSFSSYTGAETVTVSKEGPSHSVQSRNASLAPGMSFDDVVKKRMEQSRRSTDMDLPSKIKWTGISHQVSDLSMSGMKRNLDVHQAPPVKQQLPPLDSSNNSSVKNDDKIKQDRGKAEWTLMHKNSNLSANSVSFASGRTLDKSNNSASGTNEILWSVPEDRRERKGLSALKTLSSDRRRWDTQAENLDQGASPLFDYYGPQVHTSFDDQRSVEDIKPLAKQPPTQLHLSSSSVDKSRATHFLHDIPRYRRQDVGGTKLPQEAPPPIPTTLPPDEAEELTWRSPRSSDKQELEGNSHYLQQSRSTTESDPSSTMSQNLAAYLDSSNINISHV